MALSLSLAELCNFGEVDYDPQSSSDSEEWPSSWPASRSASLSSDVSALSCVSVLGSDELNRLLDDVKGLGATTLQVLQPSPLYQTKQPAKTLH